MTDIPAASAPAVPVPSSRVGRLARLRRARWLPLPVLLAGTCLIVLDFFIVNVALPSMQADLHAGSTVLEWVVAGYGLTFAVFLLAAGRLGDRLGRRRVFGAGVLVFTAASSACGLAPTGELLVVARLVQGVGAAMISPTVLALIGTLYGGAERARAIGAYATVMGLAAATGQLVGGLLLHVDVAGVGWRAVFLLNVPVGVAVLAVLRWCVPESRVAAAPPVDVVGTVLATFALAALVLPLLEAPGHRWPTWSLVCLALAPVSGAGFVVRRRRLTGGARNGLIDPAWLRERVFTVGMLTQLAFWCGQASYFLVLALYLQVGRGLSPMRSGLVFTILAAAYFAASMRAPALVARLGRGVIVRGALTLAAGHAVTFIAVADLDGRVAALAPGLLLAGAGMGLCLAPITATVLATVDPHRAGAVSGLLSTMQQVGNALGVAVIGAVFFGAVRHGYAHAFELSTAVLSSLLVAVACCARLLPPPR